MAHKSIIIKDYSNIQKEGEAESTITPGDLIELTSSDTVQRHSGSGQNAQAIFAIEDVLQGNEISDDYSSDDRVQYNAFRPGDEVYARLSTSQTIVIGDLLESAGDGTLQKHEADSAGVVEYPNAIVGKAREAVNTTGSEDRIHIEII